METIDKPEITGEGIDDVEKKTVIPNNQERNIFYNALTSYAFETRVNAGIERVRLLQAESGFSIIGNGQEIVYTPLELGGRHPNEGTYLFDRSVGMEASTNTGLSEIIEYERNEYDHKPDLKYSILATFHFHPRSSPFSSGDIEYYDQLNDGTLYDFSPHKDMFFGVFMPQFKGLSIPVVKLFMFGGLSVTNYYQAENFSRLPLKLQTEVLKKSGFKVILVNLPVKKGHVKKDPLAKLLQ